MDCDCLFSRRVPSIVHGACSHKADARTVDRATCAPAIAMLQHSALPILRRVQAMGRHLAALFLQSCSCSKTVMSTSKAVPMSVFFIASVAPGGYWMAYMFLLWQHSFFKPSQRSEMFPSPSLSLVSGFRR